MSNPTLELVDITEVSKIAHAVGALHLHFLHDEAVEHLLAQHLGIRQGGALLFQALGDHGRRQAGDCG